MRPATRSRRPAHGAPVSVALCVTASTPARNSPDNFGHAAMIFVRLESSCARSCAPGVLAVSERSAATHASRKRIQGSIPARAAILGQTVMVRTTSPRFASGTDAFEAVMAGGTWLALSFKKPVRLKYRMSVPSDRASKGSRGVPALPSSQAPIL